MKGNNMKERDLDGVVLNKEQLEEIALSKMSLEEMTKRGVMWFHPKKIYLEDLDDIDEEYLDMECYINAFVKEFFNEFVGEDMRVNTVKEYREEEWYFKLTTLCCCEMNVPFENLISRLEKYINWLGIGIIIGNIGYNSTYNKYSINVKYKEISKEDWTEVEIKEGTASLIIYKILMLIY